MRNTRESYGLTRDFYVSVLSGRVVDEPGRVSCIRAVDRVLVVELAYVASFRMTSNDTMSNVRRTLRPKAGLESYQRVINVAS